MAPSKRGRNTFVFALLPALFMLYPGSVRGQEEVASPIWRYKQHEVSTGYYEEYEVKPRNEKPMVEIPGVTQGVFPYSPGAATVRIRTRLADSHAGLKFYQRRRCDECHPSETRDIHTVRARITCRQCHGGEPVASIEHYYSPLNPIRRHAYVCAKCHEGSNASFAAYVVHEPPAGALSTRKALPALFYSYWLMVILLAGTLAFFIPHTILVGLREVIRTFRKRQG